MRETFNDVLSINGVSAIILLAQDGKILFDSTDGKGSGSGLNYSHWKKLLDVMNNAREADFVFENGRIYLRKTADGYLMVCMQSHASIAMVKLNCDILLPQINSTKSSKGLKGFFKR